MDWRVWLFILLGIVLILGLMRNAWHMLKQSEGMLKDIDKSKLKNIDEDGWDD